MYEEQAPKTAVRLFEDNSFQDVGKFNLSVTGLSDDLRQNHQVQNMEELHVINEPLITDKPDI